MRKTVIACVLALEANFSTFAESMALVQERRRLNWLCHFTKKPMRWIIRGFSASERRFGVWQNSMKTIQNAKQGVTRLNRAMHSSPCYGKAKRGAARRIHRTSIRV